MEFKLLSLNVNSLVEYRRKFMLSEFMQQNHAHIYFIQETKFGDNHRFVFNNFSAFAVNNRSGCGGALLLVHNGLRTRNFRTCVGIVDAVLIDILVSGSWTTFGSVYIHPLANGFDQLTRIIDFNLPLVLGGDFNARNTVFGDVSDNRLGSQLINLAIDENWTIKSSTSPTCYRMPEGSYIDKFVVGSNLCCATSAVGSLPSFSDHWAIAMSLFCSTFDLNVRNGFELRQYGLTNVVGLNRFIERELDELGIPVAGNLAGGDLERLAVKMGEIFSEAADRFVPRKFVGSYGVILSAATRTIINKNRTLQRKYWRARSTGLWRPGLLAIGTEVKLTRQMMENAIARDLSDHYRRTLAETERMGDLYRTVITNTGYRKRAKCPAVIYTSELKDKAIVGDANIAEEFGRKFHDNHNLTTGNASAQQEEVDRCYGAVANADISIHFDDRISAAIETNAELARVNETLPQSQKGILTSAEEVTDIIRRTPNKRSHGNDQMPYLLMKRFVPAVITLMTIFFNHLLANAYFPDDWKRSIITPIPKAGKDGSLLANWRPISSLRCISKIYERIVATRMVTHIDSLNILRRQFGFLKGHSSVHALGHFHAAVCEGLNRNEFTTMVSLDLRAAFDTVWHEAIIFKMTRLQFPIFIIKTIQAFLRNRTFVVRMGDFTTGEFPMPAGTPQGSVCSPLLFDVFTYDIPVDDFVKTLLFADDTTVYATSDNPGKVQFELNRHLATLIQYFRDWRLSINAEKSGFCIFTGFIRETGAQLRRRFRNLTISIDGHLLQREKHIKFLGVTFQQNNRFVRHIDSIILKARRSAGALRPLLRSRLIDSRLRVNLYKSYIRPILSYAAAIWAKPIVLSSHQMERLRIFERGILRTAAGIRRAIGSYKHIRNSEIYSRSNCPRIDNHLMKCSVDFFERCNDSANDKINVLANSGNCGKFPDLPNIWNAHQGDVLMTDGKLLLFNVAYNGSGSSVYSVRQ